MYLWCEHHLYPSKVSDILGLATPLGRETYISCCTVKERSGVPWFRLGIWKQRERGGVTERGKCFPCTGENSEYHPLQKCPETQRWREEVMSREWPNINEEIAIRKILTVKNTTEQKILDNLAYQIKYKQENQAKKKRAEFGRGARISSYVRLTRSKQHG